ncbi:MAG: hypothetical protein QOG85_2675 [Gaiellaceae bacterium]|nr:hypothetical protein [Gaiellaceae bacterium]
MRGLMCLVRGGHRWRTATDAAGPTTTCARCGALRHVRMEAAGHGEFKAHMNLAYKWDALPTHGAEEIDAD